MVRNKNQNNASGKSPSKKQRKNDNSSSENSSENDTNQLNINNSVRCHHKQIIGTSSGGGSGQSTSGCSSSHSQQSTSSGIQTIPVRSSSSVHKQNLYIVSFPIIFLFNILRTILYQLFILFKYLYSATSRIIYRPLKRNDCNNLELLVNNKIQHQKSASTATVVLQSAGAISASGGGGGLRSAITTNQLLTNDNNLLLDNNLHNLNHYLNNHHHHHHHHRRCTSESIVEMSLTNNNNKSGSGSNGNMGHNNNITSGLHKNNYLSSPGPGDPLLAKQKHHHRRAFEYISKALKIDEENEGKCFSYYVSNFVKKIFIVFGN